MTELLPWQSAQWQQLWQRQRADRLPHALLLVGPPGLGKLLFAQRLIQALLCESRDEQAISCGSCRSCRLFLSAGHPDCTVAEPSEPNKPIKVDQIRELCAFLGYTSQFGGYKVALVASAEQLNINAANSLLKTLEEPPTNSLLLLVTPFPSRLPATVRSRCQTVIFSEPSTEQALAWLAPRLEQGADSKLMLDLSGGAPLKALDYAADSHLNRRQTLFQCYSQVLDGNEDPISAAETWSAGDVAENLHWLIGWHMDMIRLKMTADPPRLFNPDWRSQLRVLAERSPTRLLFQRLDTVLRLQALCVTSVNPKLMLEAFLASCVNAI
ncbi:MAG: DNA polymerase III subunit delta' [Candidatus Competibacteraceae bacterium]|jgi:DNA polymerase-3 subunit delta'|nr:DNA polymerase III subunit delta' [Candidatus Competibacteraceae bacterium]